jgi:HSP20 family protein
MALTSMVPSQWLRRTTPAVSSTPVRTPSLVGSDDPFVRMHEAMDRLFDGVFNGTGGWSVDRPLADSGMATMLTPQLDIAESDNDYLLSVDLPGIDPDDIDLSTQDDTLTVRARRERKVGSSGDDHRYHRVERSFGLFERTLSLPVDADIDNISAEFKHGVLEISVPRRDDIESPGGRRIEIKTG